jgi:hypothetical protein
MNNPVHLNDMLKLEEASAWLKMNKKDLAIRSKGRKPKIPAFWFNERVVRFNPRTVIAKLAADAGVDPAVIQAMLAIEEKESL